MFQDARLYFLNILYHRETNLFNFYAEPPNLDIISTLSEIRTHTQLRTDSKSAA